MSEAPAIPRNSAWDDAVLAAALFAVEPLGTGGVTVRALAGPVRERWLALLRGLLGPAAPVRRMPLHVSDDRLLGGLDLAATLRSGRPIAERGLLAQSDGGVVIVAMAERIASSTAAHLGTALDHGELVLERDGLAKRLSARIGVVALDEGMAEDERPPAALLDRLAFHIDLPAVGANQGACSSYTAGEVAAAKVLLPRVQAGEELLAALCETSMALGIASMRAPLLALRAARAAACLAGRSVVGQEDAALAARLVLAPRATVLPVPPDQQDQSAPDDAARPESEGGPQPDAGPDEADHEPDPETQTEPELRDIVLAAAQAAIPAELLSQLNLGTAGSARAKTVGRSGVLRQAASRGRPVGVRRGELRSGARLNVIETLRAAAPWQSIRRRDQDAPASAPHSAAVQVRRDDFRITRFKHRTETTTIFAVDASGSAALHRLAEAKGAVELLLADCYVRRDRVAVVSFRGRGAELLLSPTDSLVRAKRSLAGLPGGGATPLAAGIDAAMEIADAVRRKGQTPVVVLLTDGRANITLDGKPGRPQAANEARVAARRLRAAGITALLVDTSPKPEPAARTLAGEMGARYLPLPYAEAASLSRLVRAATATKASGHG